MPLRKPTALALMLLLAACDLTTPITPPPGTTNPPTPSPAVPTQTSLPPTPSPLEPSDKVAAFYYSWYGTPQVDGQWYHWGQNNHVPPEDIGSDYYPVLGPYSSNDAAVVAKHMGWLRQAGVGVIIVSWWGQGSREEKPVPLILETAQKYGIKVAFHIEPYATRSADQLVRDIQYLYQKYGDSPAFFRSTATSTYSPEAQPRGMFFVWCIQSPATCGDQKVTASYWQAAMDKVHALPGGALVIANITDGTWVSGGHFDGLYNYATLQLEQKGGFSWAHTLPAGSLYVPSVIPGFSAQRVGYPDRTNVPRNGGQTYNDQWTAALGTGVQPALVTITSFNEWHEGSMIEPAAPGATDGRGNTYADFRPLPPDGYLALTHQWVEKFHATSEVPSVNARLQIKTTSDWTTVRVVGGGQLLRPTLLSASETAVQAGFESGDSLLLTQTIDDATAGHEVEMTWDIDLAGLQPGGTLSLQIERGNLGRTQLAVYSLSGGTPLLAGSFDWAAITTGRNTDVVSLPSDKLLAK